MARFRAFGIHLLISATIVVVVLAVMRTLWYPGSLYQAAGGSRLLLILAAVDVTIGPFITLIIFKPGKPGLKFDLTVIALLQIAALFYGMHAVFLARPVFIVFTIDRFDVVTARDIDPADLAVVPRTRFARLPLGRPQYIASVPPADPNEQLKIMSTALAGKDLQMYPQFYVPYEEQATNALAKAQSVRVLGERDSATLAAALSKARREEDSVVYLPLRARQRDAAVLLDKATGQPVRIVAIDPW